MVRADGTGLKLDHNISQKDAKSVAQFIAAGRLQIRRLSTFTCPTSVPPNISVLFFVAPPEFFIYFYFLCVLGPRQKRVGSNILIASIQKTGTTIKGGLLFDRIMTT
ncbi:hypothetical protein CEXT_664081 [Caerostris extrusa]|uniref:Uncharacterized protein n=1 Tax=Caerostris extrusa TaxID=172846 RepID=A0AAV4N350_CAEEX|nr:hypothetical protein CEXT_664081 [Caerostris extrusa]